MRKLLTVLLICLAGVGYGQENFTRNDSVFTVRCTVYTTYPSTTECDTLFQWLNEPVWGGNKNPKHTISMPIPVKNAEVKPLTCTCFIPDSLCSYRVPGKDFLVKFHKPTSWFNDCEINFYTDTFRISCDSGSAIRRLSALVWKTQQKNYKLDNENERIKQELERAKKGWKNESDWNNKVLDSLVRVLSTYTNISKPNYSNQSWLTRQEFEEMLMTMPSECTKYRLQGRDSSDYFVIIPATSTHHTKIWRWYGKWMLDPKFKGEPYKK